MPQLSARDMLLTLATMAVKMDDLTGHDVIEALKVHGYAPMVIEAREEAHSDITASDVLIAAIDECEGYCHELPRGDVAGRRAAQQIAVRIAQLGRQQKQSKKT